MLSQIKTKQIVNRVVALHVSGEVSELLGAQFNPPPLPPPALLPVAAAPPGVCPAFLRMLLLR